MSKESNLSNFNRREFLENSARNAAGLAAGAIGLGAARSPHESLQIGIIGVGEQGRELAATLASVANNEIVGICDVDARQLSIAQHEIGSRQRSRPVAMMDYRQLLDKEAVDAVIISTPDHWHAPIAMDALQAGKDIFLETPVAHSIEAGEELCVTASQTSQVVQVGLPQRSGAHFQSAVRLVQQGVIGKIHLAKAWAVHRRKSIGCCRESQPPQGVDFQQWLGPAKVRPFQENRFHENWPWFWDYGSGELGIWGIQHLDMIQWALQLGLPRRVFATGGIRSFNDDRETPDTLTVNYSYDDVEVIWEHRQWSNRGIEGRSSGVAFYGDLGTLVVDRSGWKVYDHHQHLHAEASEIKKAQMTNFLRSVRLRTRPEANLCVGQRSSILCHLGNIAYRQNQQVIVDKLMTDLKHNFTGISPANEMTS